MSRLLSLRVFEYRAESTSQLAKIEKPDLIIIPIQSAASRCLHFLGLVALRH